MLARRVQLPQCLNGLFLLFFFLLLSFPFSLVFTRNFDLFACIHACPSQTNRICIPPYICLKVQKHKVRHRIGREESGLRPRVNPRERSAVAAAPRSDDRFCQLALTLCHRKKVVLFPAWDNRRGKNSFFYANVCIADTKSFFFFSKREITSILKKTNCSIYIFAKNIR